MKPRGDFQGMLAIARFNWPFYVAAVVVMIPAAAAAFLLDPVAVKIACALAFAGAAWFLSGSLGVSHLIYDRSDLYRWKWLARGVGSPLGKHGVVAHSGFDEVSEALAEKLQGNEWTVLDHFDRETMTEASIRRARNFYPPVPGTLPCPFGRWPLEDGSADFIFGLLAIHELRSVEERAAWFAEARRCLKTDGRVVIAEHVRDAANFIAFGPGFVHFHSCASWQRSWEQAGLHLSETFRVTPWIRIFVLS